MSWLANAYDTEAALFRNESSHLRASLFARVDPAVERVQYSAKMGRLGCVNSPPAARGRQGVESRNLAFTFQLRTVGLTSLLPSLSKFWSAYVPCDGQYKDALPRLIEQMDVIKRLVGKYPDQMFFATTSAGKSISGERRNAKTVLFNGDLYCLVQ